MDPFLSGIVFGALYAALGLLLVDDVEYRIGIPKVMLGTATFWLTWLAWPVVLLVLYVCWRSRQVARWWLDRGFGRTHSARILRRGRIA